MIPAFECHIDPARIAGFVFRDTETRLVLTDGTEVVFLVSRKRMMTRTPQGEMVQGCNISAPNILTVSRNGQSGFDRDRTKECAVSALRNLGYDSGTARDCVDRAVTAFPADGSLEFNAENLTRLALGGKT